MLTVGSLFSGIGGFDLGLERAGFEVAFQCDNDPFSNKVLAHRWPGVKRYDDVRHIGNSDGESAQPGQQPRAVDLVCGGFPCQDLSVAGKRAGLDGARSGLWFEFYRILSELRPRVALIENVPGLLSSNQGRDFGVILSGLEQLWPGCWGWAVLDSQHFGVAQRRRRLYVVAGPRRERIAQILSLCEGGDWHPAKGRAPGEDVAFTLSASVRGTGDGHGNAWNTSYVPDVSHALNAKGGSGRSDYESETFLAHSLRAEGFDASEDGTGRGTPLTVIQDARGVRNKKQNGIGIQQTETMYTLDGTSQHAVHTASVRRLTPTECERLQGFPDGWTDVDGAKDGPRYKALGNAVTVPVIEYLGHRILAALESGHAGKTTGERR